MVKFDDAGRADYQQLEGLIIKMILNHLTLHTPTARPTEEAQYHAGDSTSSPQSQSPASSPDRKYGDASQQRFAVPPAINNYITINGYGNPQPAMPSRQQTAPVHAGQPGLNQSSQTSLPRNPWSDTIVPSVHTNGPSEKPNAPRRKTDSQTTRTNDDDDIFNRLKMFDTVFIVDDTGSMGLPVSENAPDGPDRWEVTKDALKHVADIAARHDDDGIDIRFLKADELDESNIHSGERVKEILANVDVTDPNHGGGTVFRDQLETVMWSYLNRYKNYVEEIAEFDKNYKRRAGMHDSPKKPKFLNLIVITDGQADDEEEVEEYIVKVAKKLDEMDAPNNYIGIQFIQIGDDEKATKFLQRLDDELKTQTNPIRDVSVPSNYSFPSWGW